jgi:nitrogen regulatory protein PII-like uncharacterized protein
MKDGRMFLSMFVQVKNEGKAVLYFYSVQAIATFYILRHKSVVR